ncbi:MAG: Asp-tRNA(Asn)/Glu-tRNA(Gln) amidotransferase subunit GatB [Treponema sp.]
MSSELEYEVIIGCEIHCQLLTKTKAFCACENRYGGMPNSRVCPVCLGLPGALPVISDEYVRLGIKAGFALGCTINRFSKFDRKHYYYPDLVKGYQITQFDKPICENGKVELNMAAPNEPPQLRTIRIERIHLEEDAGKSLHIEGRHSYVDYNRCGVPLIEIVSKPDMKTPAEAAVYMQTIREILKFTGVTDGNLEEGAMRCDANINLKIFEDGKEYRTPISEVKNMNSFKAVRDACSYEITRQLEEFKTDRQVYVEGFKRTMGWDEASGKTVIQRTKNSCVDYRFMPEPDIRPVVLTEAYIDEVCHTVGELPAAKRERFKKEYHLSEFDVQTLTSEKKLAEWFEQAAVKAKDGKKAANWILAEVLAVLNEGNVGLDDLLITPDHIAELVNALEAQTITSKQAKDVFAEMLETGAHPAEIIAAKGLAQVSDAALIEQLVDEVFAENTQALTDWKNGKTNVAGWLMGQVMKKSKGKANPNQATQFVQAKLQKLV